ncbi:MAG: histidine kinase [Bacteroidota bacterium]
MFNYKYRYFFIILLSIYSVLNILFTGGDRLVDMELPIPHLLILIFIVVTGIWEGNSLLMKLIGKNGYFLPNIHPLIKLFLGSVLIVFLISSILTYGIFKFYSLESFSTEFKLSLGFSFRVNLFLNCVNAIVFYINQHKNAQLETQELKKKNIEAQFEILKNQINPHFLFNSFNVLSSLVYENPELAGDFIERLSKVYRYILTHKEHKLVDLREEINFLKSYLFLLEVRYDKNLKTEIDLPEKYFDNYQIPPATLQILIENVIKHNIVSEKKKLNIKISNNFGTYLTVTNNLQLKTSKEESTSVGLANIQERFEFLTKDPVIIESNEGEFKVRLPLIGK